MRLTVEISQHAVHRYIERVKPGLGFDAARDELHRLLREYGRVDERPGWVRTEPQDTDTYLVVGDDIALPVANEIAVTCLVRGQGARTPANTAERDRFKGRAARPRESNHLRREEKYRKRHRRLPIDLEDAVA